jgi:hypothetical protein
MGSISEQDYQDILRESVGAWFRTDEDDEDEKNGFEMITINMIRLTCLLKKN